MRNIRMYIKWFEGIVLSSVSITRLLESNLKMKFIIVFSALFAVALSAAVPQDSAHAETLRFDNDNIGVEGYKYA